MLREKKLGVKGNRKEIAAGKGKQTTTPFARQKSNETRRRPPRSPREDVTFRREVTCLRRPN